jgi:hypothetical protein
LESAILDVLTRRYRGERIRLDFILDEVSDAFGVLPHHAQGAVLDNGDRSRVHLRMFDVHGPTISGDRVNSKYLDVAPTAIGQLAALGEQNLGPRVPIGLINGTMYAGGRRPAFDPWRVMSALDALTAQPETSSAALAELMGNPFFPTPSSVDGDMTQFHTSGSCRLNIRPEWNVQAQWGQLLVTPPPYAPSTDDLDADLVANLGGILGDSYRVHYAGQGDDRWIGIFFPPGVDPAALGDRLVSEWPLNLEVVVDMPPNPVSALREWWSLGPVVSGEEVATALEIDLKQ